jgi:hypothetical protein
LADADIAFAPAEGAPVCTKEQRTTPQHNWGVVRDLAADMSTLEVINDDGTVRFPDLNLDLQRRALEWYRYQGMDFCSARGETLWERGFRRGDWSVRTVTRTVLTSTSTHFQIHAQLDAFEGERRVHAEIWSEDVGRDLVWLTAVHLRLFGYELRRRSVVGERRFSTEDGTSRLARPRP